MRRVKFRLVRLTYIGRSRRHSLFAEGIYDLEYPKGEVVRAIEGTLGVSVFKTRKQAKSFQDKYLDLKLIHVRPIGRGKTVGLICTDAREIPLDIFYHEEQGCVSKSRVPPGTMFYPAVEVLD